ncbi:MAG: STAS domain-containing protein, partial [Holosporaceae bacterium]|nr:STAS domain-containing protein [Holosporaceae bacterium]
MEIKTSVEDGITIITPVGRVDTSTAKAFEDGVIGALNSSSKIAIRFNEIDYMSSAGLRVVLMAGKKLTASKGTLVLVD